MRKPWNYKDLTNQKFNKLKVVGSTDKRTSNGGMIWKCQCDCGNVVYLSTPQLKRNKGCGCELKKWRKKFGENSKKNRININNNLYKRLKHMKERCYDANNKEYKNYGARGIRICDEWKNDFMSFYNWAVANGYKENLTLDRIDVNGNYEPNNCRWVDWKTQQNNRRNNVRFKYNGIELTQAEWARKLKTTPQNIYKKRLKGWSIEQIVQFYESKRKYRFGRR